MRFAIGCMYFKVAHFKKKTRVHKSLVYNVKILNFVGIMGSMIIKSMYQKQ